MKIRILGAKTYFTGKPCKHGHVSERRFDNNSCVECQRIKCRKYGKENPEANRVRTRRSRERNLEKVRARGLAYAAANREKEAARARRWREQNHGRKIAEVTARKAHVRRATPPWADLDAIRQIYIECERISREAGIVHHVDHQTPLRGKFVSGLHVAGNLQIIPAADNLAKGNRHAD